MVSTEVYFIVVSGRATTVVCTNIPHSPTLSKVTMLTYTDAHVVSDAERVEFLEFALAVAERAGRVTLRGFRGGIEVANKSRRGGFDPVTEADRAAEKLIRESIASSYPEHGIFGEEFGLQAGNGLTWVIDPIDGTRAFMTGMLHWGVLIGLFDGQRPVLGVLHQPFTKEFFAGDGRNAHYRCGKVSRSLRSREQVSLAEASLATTSPHFFSTPDERDALVRLEAEAKLTRYGGDCYIYGMLAMGQVDVATDANLNPYDILPLIPIIQGAGGIVTTAAGGDASMGGFVIASANQALHEEVLEIVNSVPG